VKIIVEAQALPAKLWGRQKPKETMYRLMRFLLRTECDDGTLLHNVVTGELVLLDAAETALLEQLPAAHTAAMDALIEAHFLVPVEFDEKKSVEQLRRLMRAANRSRELVGYTILPTTGCNARCFYCYEAGIPYITMTEETADRLAAFIDAHHGEKPVELNWFGGEPTLGVNIIDRICRAMQEREIEYTSSMISNGYLFDETLAEKAKKLWKLKNIQITLDGTEPVYNRVKAYVRSDGSPYRKVLENIGFLLAQEIRVSVRMNLDRYNAEDLETLIAELAQRFAGQKYFSAYTWPLYDNCGYTPVVHNQEERLWLENKSAELNRLIEQKQIDYIKDKNLPSVKAVFCMADSDAAVIVNPDGTFSKCEHECGKENVGNLEDGFTDAERIATWKKQIIPPECEDCVLYPSCFKIENCISAGQCFAVNRDQKIESYFAGMIAAWKNSSVNGGGEHEGI